MKLSIEIVNSRFSILNFISHFSILKFISHWALDISD